MNIKLFFTIVFCWVLPKLFCQNNIWIIKGNISNEQTNLSVTKAIVSIPEFNKEFESDKYGNFIFALPSGRHILQISHPDFEITVLDLRVFSDTSLQIQLKPILISYMIEEVSIISDYIDKVEDSQISIERIESKAITRIPAIGGEKDVVKVLQFLPGVQSGSEGSADLIVRGGTPDQNLFLLDNTTLYNSNHLLGFLSSYNPLIVSRVNLYKAGFPPRFGGRLSSILDVESKEPDRNNIDGELDIGLLSSKVSLQLPIIPGKSTLMISGRRTYFDTFLKAISNDNEFESLNFHDLFIKWMVFTKKNKLLISAYTDRDKIYEINEINNQEVYRNENILIRNNKFFNTTLHSDINSRISNNFYLQLIEYKLNIQDISKRADSVSNFNALFESRIYDFVLKNRFVYEREKFSLSIGFEAINHHFEPATIHWSDFYIDTTVYTIPKIQTLEMNGFTSLNFKMGDIRLLQIGLRFSNYFIDNKIYNNFEPRIIFSQKFNNHLTFKSSYSRITQPIHLLTNPGLGMPIDLWMSSDNYLVPEYSDHIAIGLYKKIKLKESEFTLSMESYYKTMHNIISYKDGFSSNNFTAQVQNSPENIEDILTIGKGKSYGLELMFDKYSGKFTGWIAYTLSWTKFQFDDLNDGKPFFSRYDRRHDISLVTNYRINSKYELSINWVYGTGQAITIPLYTYNSVNFDYINGSFYPNNGDLIYYGQSKRNGFRMKDFHRLDIGLRRYFPFKWGKGFLEIGVYNLYNRKNPYYYYAEYNYVRTQDEYQGFIGKREIKSVSLFPIIPSINLNIKF